MPGRLQKSGIQKADLSIGADHHIAGHGLGSAPRPGNHGLRACKRRVATVPAWRLLPGMAPSMALLSEGDSSPGRPGWRITRPDRSWPVPLAHAGRARESCAGAVPRSVGWPRRRGWEQGVAQGAEQGCQRLQQPVVEGGLPWLARLTHSVSCASQVAHGVVRLLQMLLQKCFVIDSFLRRWYLG